MENESRRSSEIRRVSCQENRETAEERNALWSTLFVKRNFLASSKLKWPQGSFSRGAKYQILSCAMLQMGSPRATGICSPSVCLSLHFTYLLFLWNKSNFLKSCRYVCLFVTICTKKQVETLHATFTKSQRMFEIVILTTGFGEFEFFRTFSHLLLPDKKCGIIQIKSPELSKSAGKSNSPKYKKVRKIQIPKM